MKDFAVVDLENWAYQMLKPLAPNSRTKPRGNTKSNVYILWANPAAVPNFLAVHGGVMAFGEAHRFELSVGDSETSWTFQLVCEREKRQIKVDKKWFDRLLSPWPAGRPQARLDRLNGLRDLENLTLR
ncbi:MAG: hypothetical protein ACFFCW_28110 [Candidatus Hodarchaeota archaeon]